MAVKTALFTEQEVATIRSAALSVWNEVAFDLMSAVREEGKSTIPRAEVIEVVCDAGRLEEELKRRNPELVTKWEAQGYKEMEKFMKKHVFLHARYE